MAIVSSFVAVDRLELPTYSAKVSPPVMMIVTKNLWYPTGIALPTELYGKPLYRLSPVPRASCTATRFSTCRVSVPDLLTLNKWILTVHIQPRSGPYHHIASLLMKARYCYVLSWGCQYS